MSRFIATLTGTAWLKRELEIEATDLDEAEQKVAELIAKDQLDDADWEIVELDKPVITEFKIKEPAKEVTES